MNGSINTFDGFVITESKFLREFKPKLELKQNVIVSDKFREDFNRYLLDMFGTTREMVVFGNKIFMHPNTYQMALREFKQPNFML